MKTLNILTLALGLMIVILTSGCTSPNGPVTPANVWNNYPPKIRAVNVNLAASLVTIDFEPYPADVKVEGWFILPGDNVSRRNINFASSILHGTDTMNGRGNFVMASYDWPYGYQGSALTPGITYYFMITVAADDGRQVVKVYQFKDGALTQISMTRNFTEEKAQTPQNIQIT